MAAAMAGISIPEILETGDWSTQSVLKDSIIDLQAFVWSGGVI